MEKEILINKLFTGSYLEEDNNIGHEVINYFKDDDGNYNIYITADGSVKNHNLEYILFVRYFAKKTVEVIGIAKGIRYIKQEEIDDARYGGISLNQIFKSNTYKGQEDISSKQITFRVDKFLYPLSHIYITMGEYSNSNDYVLQLHTKHKVIVPEGLRSYHSEKDDPKAYFELKELIEKDEFWTKENTIKKLFAEDKVMLSQLSLFEQAIGNNNEKEIEKKIEKDIEQLKGRDKETIIKSRVNQSVFRNKLLE
nr:hypothetical protein [Lachnospiraceae bacterium]